MCKKCNYKADKNMSLMTRIHAFDFINKIQTEQFTLSANFPRQNGKHLVLSRKKRVKKGEK